MKWDQGITEGENAEERQLFTGRTAKVAMMRKTRVLGGCISLMSSD